MHQDSCPHCRTRSGLNNYSVLVLSLDNLPMVILYSLVVIAFGDKFSYSTSSTVLFALFAVIPLVFSFSKKISCDNCGMDFRNSAVSKRKI